MRALVIGFMVLAAGCSSNELIAERSSSDTMITTSTPPAGEGGTPYSVTADPNATYSLLEVRRGKGGNVIAMTRRTGSSGTSYSNRKIDCDARLARYIGEGDTRDEAKKAAPNPGGMATLVEGSSTHAAFQAACAAR